MHSQVKRAVNASLGRFGYRIVKTPSSPTNSASSSLKRLKAESVEGWFSRERCRGLYALIVTTTGPILEIGHFLGRSTACICEAMADTGQHREFRSYDIGFKSSEDFKEFYLRVLGQDIVVPPKYVSDVFAKEMTTTEIALRNIRSLGFETYVDLVSGDFIELDAGRYDVIFCDAMHQPEEIAFNLPHIIERSNPGCIWAFDDMNAENISAILSSGTAVLADCADLLGIFRYVGHPGPEVRSSVSKACGSPRTPHALSRYAGNRAGQRADLVIVRDLFAWRRGHTHPGEVCHIVGGGPIPVELAHELGQNAFLKAVLHDGLAVHTIKHFGRRAPGKLRTAPRSKGVRSSAGRCGERAWWRRREYGMGLNHLPSGRFAANAAWIAFNVMAHNLTKWVVRIGLHQTLCATKTVRRQLFSMPGRIAWSGRRFTLHLPLGWPWRKQSASALENLRSLPAAPALPMYAGDTSDATADTKTFLHVPGSAISHPKESGTPPAIRPWGRTYSEFCSHSCDALTTYLIGGSGRSQRSQ